MENVAAGTLEEIQLGGLLIALRAKGCVGVELAAFASVLRRHAIGVQTDFTDLVDTCGTGGGIPSFNLSTGAAIVAAAAGARVAKHGNRSVSSRCGSADVLEHLGVKLELTPERAAVLLDRVRLAFLFAPAFHPSLRKVGKVRKALGVRTVFNQLGPLLNPANARRQLIGVFSPELLLPMGEALREMGAERALIVCSSDGLDEISPCAPTEFVELRSGSLIQAEMSPEEFGLAHLDPSAVEPGENVEQNARILVAALKNDDPERAAALVPNAAAALWLGGVAETMMDAANVARAALESGAAIGKLNELISESNTP